MLVYNGFEILAFSAFSIWLKLDSFDRSLLKSEVRRFSEKSVRPPPSCKSPLEIKPHLVHAIGN
jgi:hypothetical protein